MHSMDMYGPLVLCDVWLCLTTCSLVMCGYVRGRRKKNKVRKNTKFDSHDKIYSIFRDFDTVRGTKCYVFYFLHLTFFSSFNQNATIK